LRCCCNTDDKLLIPFEGTWRLRLSEFSKSCDESVATPDDVLLRRLMTGLPPPPAFTVTLELVEEEEEEVEAKEDDVEEDGRVRLAAPSVASTPNIM